MQFCKTGNCLIVSGVYTLLVDGKKPVSIETRDGLQTDFGTMGIFKVYTLACKFIHVGCNTLLVAIEKTHPMILIYGQIKILYGCCAIDFCGMITTNKIIITTKFIFVETKFFEIFFKQAIV